MNGAAVQPIRRALEPVLLALAVAVSPSLVYAQGHDISGLRRSITGIVDSVTSGGNVAGLAVAVVHGPDTLVLKGWGRADVEWNMAMPADAVFEIGSVTKQFTAAAVLQLAEQRKLSLEDDLTRYLPDYDTQGQPRDRADRVEAVRFRAG